MRPVLETAQLVSGTIRVQTHAVWPWSWCTECPLYPSVSDTIAENAHRANKEYLLFCAHYYAFLNVDVNVYLTMLDMAYVFPKGKRESFPCWYLAIFSPLPDERTD